MLSKSFSKTLNQERIILSNNRNLGGSQQMRKFHVYHANYLTKSGFEILPGECGGKGSYNAASFWEVKEIERNRIEEELNDLIFKLSLENENYQNYKNAKHYQSYYEQRIQKIKNYLTLAEFNDFEKKSSKEIAFSSTSCSSYSSTISLEENQDAELLEHWNNTY